tara:strand:- start:4430 stop:5314 length:885 start_codon:yes stop_codon:yes gene_type:complete
MNIRRRPPNPAVKVANLEYGVPHSESEPKNILEKILWKKNKELEIDREKIPLAELKNQVLDLPKTIPFLDSLKEAAIKPAVIAEIKKASPSKGLIRDNFNPKEIANSYQEAGAACLSVLTEKHFFMGGFDVLKKVRQTVQIPLLCKDFIFTPYQLYQARAAGADAVLLIAAILSDQDLVYLRKIAVSLDLQVLVEVHNTDELARIINIGNFNLIGINNRDLKTFHTDLSVTEKLISTYQRELQQEKILIVSESGLSSRNDLNRVYSAGARAVLIGESLMRKEDIKQGLVDLIED